MSSSLTTDTPQHAFTLASYNIRKAVGLDWKRDPSRIMSVIGEINADIVAIQEVDKRFGKREATLPVNELVHEMGYNIATWNISEHSMGWHGNAILYREEAFELEKCYTIDIPTLEPRGAVVAHLRHVSGTNLTFIATHLSLAGFMRRRQMLYLMKMINDELDEGFPVVIAGDFNEWRTNGKAVRDLTADYQVVTPGNSFHSSNPVLPLDRFVVSRHFKVLEKGVHISQLAQKASDHLPIHMRVSPI